MSFLVKVLRAFLILFLATITLSGIIFIFLRMFGVSTDFWELSRYVFSLLIFLIILSIVYEAAKPLLIAVKYKVSVKDARLALNRYKLEEGKKKWFQWTEEWLKEKLEEGKMLDEMMERKVKVK